MTSAQLFFLNHPSRCRRRYGLADEVRAVANHHVDPCRLELSYGFQNVGEQRAPGQRVQNFRQARVHACALTGRQNDHFEWRAGGRNHVCRNNPCFQDKRARTHLTGGVDLVTR